MTGTASLLMANTEGGSDGITENTVLEAVGRSLKVAQGTLGYGDGPLQPPKSVEHRYFPYYLALAFNDTADKVVKAAFGFLHTLNIPNTNMTGTGMALTIYDNTAGSGVVIAVIDPTVRGSYLLDIECTTGITMKLSGTGSAGTANITLGYR